MLLKKMVMLVLGLMGPAALANTPLLDVGGFEEYEVYRTFVDGQYGWQSTGGSFYAFDRGTLGSDGPYTPGCYGTVGKAVGISTATRNIYHTIAGTSEDGKYKINFTLYLASWGTNNFEFRGVETNGGTQTYPFKLLFGLSAGKYTVQAFDAGGTVAFDSGANIAAGSKLDVEIIANFATGYYTVGLAQWTATSWGTGTPTATWQSNDITLNDAPSVALGGIQLYSNASGSYWTMFDDLIVRDIQTATATFSPDGGAIAESQDVEISCSTSNAVIRYSFDGEPTLEDEGYSSPVTVTVNPGQTLYAKAWATGCFPSELKTATYTAVLFQSDFTGTQGSAVSSLPEWSLPVSHVGSSQTIDNNMSKFYGSGAAVYSTLRADRSEGVPYNFHSISATGNRFEHTVMNVTSTWPITLNHRIWLTNATATVYSFRSVGEVAMLDMGWNNNMDRLTYKLKFINNKTGNVNQGVEALSTYVDGVDFDAGDHVRVALELRDGGGSDVRIAVKKYTASTDTWGAWITSDWFDPTDAAYGANAFDADWKNRWENSTYYYIETTNTNNHTDTVWIDDVTVTGDLTGQVATPTFTPDGVRIAENQDVEISCSTLGSEIRYTLDGSIPGKDSSLYTEAVSVSPGETLTAKAWAAGYSPSEVKTAVYPAVEILFQSDFTGTQGSAVSSLPEWSLPVSHVGSSQTIDNNMSKFYGSGAAVYSTLRADRSEGVPYNFHSISATGNRFEHTVMNVTSTWPITLNHRIWLTNATATVYSFRSVGEVAMLDMGWNNNMDRLTYKLKFINNKTGNVNQGVEALSTYVDGVDFDAGDHVRVALELRDGGGSDVRIAVKKYTASTDTWGEWITSDWFDPTNAAYEANAFDSDWKNRWENSTYYYIETTNTNNYTDNVWIDDARVTGDAVENVAATPVFTPDDRYVLGSKKVAISCATPDSQIRYTLDGSTPSPASSLYSTPITINLGETLCARAWADGFVVSDVKSVTYTAFNNPMTIQSDDGSVSVDGDLSEWRGSEFVALDKTYSGSSPITQAGYAVRWDGTANQFYVAVKVNDPDRIFLDMYDKWNTQDGVEIYVHTTGGEPYAYEDTQSTAQQYVVGLKANRTGNPANDLWKTFAGDNPISGELAGQIGFQAAGVVEVDGQGNPTGWLFYEAAVKAYEYLDLTGGESIVSPLSAGDIVGVDVVICDKYASGFGMKSENTLLTKHDDWRSIGVHKLAPDWIDASTFGFESDDATFALQAAIDSGAKTVFVPDMGSDWFVRPIMLNSNNQEIVFEEGVVVCAKEGAFLRSTDCLFKAVAKQDLKLTGYGATLKMRKNDYLSSPYEDGEWRMGVGLWSCGNVTISGLTIKDTGGDGVYMGIWANEQNFCNDIVIRDVTFDNNYRQGISVISAERLLVENCVIRNTNGHSPQAGIDFEPNYDTQRLVDCVVRGTIIEGNAGDGILFSLNQMSSTNRNNATVTIEKCSLIGNGNHGLYLKNSLPGLAVRDSLFVGNDRYGVYQTIFMSPSPNIRYSAFWNNGSGAAGGSASLGTGCLTTVGPIFASADPLSEQYRYLALTCPAAITAGASDGSYMGARPKVSASRVPGDANEDGKVDVGDLGILAANYGMSEGATWQQGDFNEDGKVDVGDLGILAANYGSSGSSFEADYAKVFGTAVENEESAEDDFSSSICSGFGLPMIAGFILAGLMLVRLEE